MYGFIALKPLLCNQHLNNNLNLVISALPNKIRKKTPAKKIHVTSKQFGAKKKLGVM